MRGAIFSTIAAAFALVAPAAAAPAKPEPGTDASCTEKSTMLTDWVVVDFDYHESKTFSTPSHQVARGDVIFKLNNPATNYTTSCRGDSSHLDVFFLGDVTYKCDVQASEDAATFTFSRPTGKLTLSQAWSCPKEGSRFVAKGGVTLDLKCKTDKWKNDHWEKGSLYSSEFTKCDLVTIPAPIDSLSVVG
ncbi:hypothetical protein ESCO_003670 [Escovopsis weberi]|uniref:AA1-like domain-containing protein n=1 Tax=Escovopsis weberi TaxID=150374 RepID=A0A0N0RU84_ESCWE|nr:hypothetical protein ESCO_003670 [Escovopsis weberi]